MSEVLVLLSGVMCDARVWAAQIAALSARATIILPRLAADRIEGTTAALLAELPPRFALAGQGLGGVVALEVMRRAPERVMRLALLATTPLAESPAAAAAREPRIIAAQTGRLAEMVRAEYPPEALAQGPLRGRAMALLAEMAEAGGAAAYVAQSRLLQRRRDQQDILRRIRVPVLVLGGAQDGVVGVKRQEFLAGFIPGAQLVIVPGAGHLPSVEAPEAVSAALAAWLAAPLVLH